MDKESQRDAVAKLEKAVQPCLRELLDHIFGAATIQMKEDPLLDTLHGRQSKDHCLVLEHAVHVQPW